MIPARTSRHFQRFFFFLFHHPVDIILTLPGMHSLRLVTNVAKRLCRLSMPDAAATPDPVRA